MKEPPFQTGKMSLLLSLSAFGIKSMAHGKGNSIKMKWLGPTYEKADGGAGKRAR